MTRIIAGVAGGRSIRVPKGEGTRPTSDRVREALFSSLAARDHLDGVRVFDLYAGSGALGLEALSRGAAAATLVESDRVAAGVIRANVSALSFRNATVVNASVESFLGKGSGGAYDLVFCDPPYALSQDALHAVLSGLDGGEWLAPDALIVVERSRRSPEPPWPTRWEQLGPKRYGETTVWFAQAAGSGADPSGGD